MTSSAKNQKVGRPFGGLPAIEANMLLCPGIRPLWGSVPCLWRFLPLRAPQMGKIRDQNFSLWLPVGKQRFTPTTPPL
jgi:hypothetical protein